MPDIDIDFCFERRQEVIDYVVEKYGKDRPYRKLEIIVYHQGYCHGQNNIDHDGKPQIKQMDISIVAMNMGIIKRILMNPSCNKSIIEMTTDSKIKSVLL